MSQIRQLTEDDFDAFVAIVARAYPGMKILSAEDREKLKQRLLRVHREEPTANFYGLFRDGQMLGGMRLHEFTMNLFSTRAKAGGVGLVAVDLLHKKEKVAKEMIEYFLAFTKSIGGHLAMLYPFRPDFYKKMGFGYGTKINQYRVKPENLPGGRSKAHVHSLGMDDLPSLADCYNRTLERTTGMIEKSDTELTAIFNNPENQVVGFRREGNVEGYIIFSFKPFKPDNFLVNDLHIKEMIYNSTEALGGLMAFLHSQADQISEVVINTQDPELHFLFFDPRNGSNNLIPPVFHEITVQGLGVMYRVVDIPGIIRALQQRDFGRQTCRVKLTIDDSFFPPNHGSTIVHFAEGRPEVQSGGEFDVEIHTDVANFSSLLMGVVPFSSLYKYGLVTLSDARYAPVMDQLFATAEKPVCMTAF